MSIADQDAGQPWGAELPLVGRAPELQKLRDHLTEAIAGRGACVLVSGDAGIGKSRLLAEMSREALKRGVLVASGRAFAMEAGIPYGALADALARPLRTLDAATLTVLARGSERDMRAVVPGLAGAAGGSDREFSGDAEAKAHLLWNVAQFLTRWAARAPILLILDNAHASDASSLEFLHFLARQVSGARILIVLGFLEQGRDTSGPLHEIVRSLLATRDASLMRVESLTRADLTELLQRSFALEADDAVDHAAVLWSHTRGNPFFIDESLKALTAAGRIRKTDGRWLIDDTLPATLPQTVRDAVEARLASLDAAARRIAEIASIVESRPSLALLGAVSGLDALTLADAIDTLCGRRIFIEHRTGDSAEYEFAHPIIAVTVRESLTVARERALHSAVARALEALFGDVALERASEMARHLVLGQEHGGDDRSLRYLTAAGRDAIARRADQEATRWLREALAIAERLGSESVAALMEDLATARARLGDVAEATALWHRALTLADARNDPATRTRLLIRLAQEQARVGNASAGLDLLDLALQSLRGSTTSEFVVRIGLARAKMLQALGRHVDAIRSVQETLGVADAIGDAAMLARVHQTALQLYAWTGPASLAREHGARAIRLAEESSDRDVAWAAHWAMAMLEGFTGDVDGVARHMSAASAHAESLASPMLHAMTAEIEIEYASGVGRWDEALAIAERTIPLARAVMPNSLLPRLLVWTGLIVLARDDTERARALLEEAWTLSGAAQLADDFTDGALAIGNVHNVILAHTGMGTFSLSHGDWRQALTFGERGLALADRFGYVAWAIHRLIPMIIEASLRIQDFDRVELLTTRLRRQSTDLGHRLGMAWAAAADALVARVKHQSPDAAMRLLAAADELDAVPFVFHGARIRRNAAQVLEADGDIDAAATELRRAHDVFAKLGAEFELRGVRTQLRALGVRLPPRTSQAGAASLTGRELEIARAVARRLTNKEIGTALDISARTVSTHLSNIFEKLGVDSRGALADAVRSDPQLREA
ncbi:MAG: AAA family ATPase [Gemmatimonadaceae bacterium]|nr:AAA family ATPase [Gemmatimonadaceae bacterium]